MWYAVQVVSGRQNTTKELCHILVDNDTLTECFIPKYERMKRYQGRCVKIWREK